MISFARAERWLPTSSGVESRSQHQVESRLQITISLVALVIALDSPIAADVQLVLQRHWDFLHAPKHTAGGLTSPPKSSHHYLDTNSLLAPEVSFFSARVDGSVVAIGAMVEIDSGHGEIKSMHVVVERRGQGLGQKMVEHLIGVARKRGFARVSLETGSMPEFEPARALYTSAGFVDCGPFADYKLSVHSRFMTQVLE